uniref:Squalene monooxygenase n=1 Tax=Huperzia serrata TaxID=355589 RepID=I7BL63_HUPSR|nr:squalene epoxidase [Huperzia serrata]
MAEFRDGNIVEGWLRKMSLILPILFLWLVSAVVLIFYFFSETSRGRRSEPDVQQQQQRRKPRPSARIAENQQREPNNNENEEVDCIIVGAGVAGAALACTLAKDGRKVKVFERDLSEQDRIVGELLQPGGYMKLLELGLEDCVEEIDAQKVFGYAIFKKEANTKVAYPLEGYASNISGRGFHNGRFVQRMRTKAAANPLIQLEQANVLSLIESDGIVKGIRYRSSEGEEKNFYAPMTFVCDGSFSNLRRAVSNPKVRTPSWFVGLIIENPASLPFPNHGHVILADPSPLLFYPISSTEVRCLVDIPGENIPSGNNGQLTKYLRTVIADQLPLKLRKPFLEAIEKCKIRSMPNKSMPAIPRARPGVLILGDAFNMRHPLTGGGMTVALSDIVILRDLLRPVKDFSHAQSLCDCLQDFYVRRKPIASTINILADSLYKVFSASDYVEEERRKACFEYLSLGGMFASGPMGLLGAIHPSIAILVFHFLLLTGYGLVRVLMPFPSPSRLWIAARLVWKAPDILLPSLRNEGFLPTLNFKTLMANKSRVMWSIFILSTLFLLAWPL